MIYPRYAVKAAYDTAMTLYPTHEAAVAAGADGPAEALAFAPACARFLPAAGLYTSAHLATRAAANAEMAAWRCASVAVLPPISSRQRLVLIRFSVCSFSASATLPSMSKIFSPSVMLGPRTERCACGRGLQRVTRCIQPGARGLRQPAHRL